MVSVLNESHAAGETGRDGVLAVWLARPAKRCLSRSIESTQRRSCRPAKTTRREEAIRIPAFGLTAPASAGAEMVGRAAMAARMPVTYASGASRLQLTKIEDVSNADVWYAPEWRVARTRIAKCRSHAESRWPTCKMR